ncbi:MAG: adenylate/guanylate cyclase domain-containing protein [Chloroflexi bacterium]|nr:MAG: adenylate/guanylate cyclase domain-containing protein [Chloroflexota bacterium]
MTGRTTETAPNRQVLSPMPALPSGTVTFLFSDIEGSTHLAERLGDRWPVLLGEHRTIVREAVASGGGTEVGTEGDSFFVAFPTAGGAVSTAVEAQRQLADHAWPEEAAIRIRIGLHTGEASLAGNDYVGLDVHRAARIASAGHGGQVLLSDTTRALVESSLPEGVTTRDLGQRRLKDLSRPERIHQLVIEGLPSEFPPLKTLDATPNNLPIQLSSFLGRERELDEVEALLERSRLLTLTGPGGTGKTRLSLQVGAREADRFPDGIFFVPLSLLRDPELVPGTIAQELGLPDRGGLSPMTALTDHLRERRTLLILDNFEQVADAAPRIAELLTAAPGLAILATSRSALRIYGEREYPVPPLATPDPRLHESPERLSQYESVALFIERAMGVKPDFQVTNENAPAVAEISARLDGLPLAIELAAARINVLPPQAMLARLGDRLGLLSGGARDRPERQQTLRGAIDWSYDLLTEDERALFRRLAVFAGGARLDAIESVCPGDELKEPILDGLGSLVEKSLLRQVAAGDGEPRFFMLGTIREYALERLAESGREDELRRAHARHFAALVEQAAPQLLGSDKRRWLDWLEEDHDNLRAAFDWSVETAKPPLALDLVSKLWRFWQMRGYLLEGTDRTRRALALPRAADFPTERADALEAAGGLAWWRGDFKDAVDNYDACLTIRRAQGDPGAIAEAAYNLAFPLGGFAGATSDSERSYALIGEALELWQSIGDELGIAKGKWLKGTIAWSHADFDVARGVLAEAMPVFRRLEQSFMLGWSLFDLGLLAIHEHEPELAREQLSEALRIFANAADVSGYTLVIDALAALAEQLGDRQRAAVLSGAVASLERQSGTGLNPWNREVVGFDPAPLRADPETAAAWAAGERMSGEEAVAYALSEATPAKAAAGG